MKIIIAGIAFIIAGLVMMYAFYNLVDIGLIVAIIGMICIVIGIFTPKVEAKGIGYPSAGITEVMAKALSQPVEVEPSPVEEVAVASSDDIDLLARLITAEVGYSQNYDPLDYERACYLAGSVVLNRMSHEKFPDTLREVIYQEGQYSPTWNGAINCEYDEIAFEISEELLTYGTTIDESVVYEAAFPQGHGTYEYINGNYFCYE